MPRFRPTTSPNTLPDKALSELSNQRFKPPSQRKRTVQVAASLGMDSETRNALARLLGMAETRKTGVAGTFMPDPGVAALLASRGIIESLDEADFFRVRVVATPYSGIPPRTRRDWLEQAVPLEDFTATPVRKAQVALGLLRIEGAHGLVIGRHDDPESLAIAGGSSHPIIQDTTDTARLVFHSAFGVVCQSTLSPRRVSWLLEQLRLRYRDARVTYLDTSANSMRLREEALEKVLVTSELALIVGQAGEATVEALAETALRRGKAAVVVTGPQELETLDLDAHTSIALTAGGFVLDETLHAIANQLSAC